MLSVQELVFYKRQEKLEKYVTNIIQGLVPEEKLDDAGGWIKCALTLGDYVLKNIEEDNLLKVAAACAYIPSKKHAKHTPLYNNYVSLYSMDHKPLSNERLEGFKEACSIHPHVVKKLVDKILDKILCYLYSPGKARSFFKSKHYDDLIEMIESNSL
jgi:hypothetical protein